MKTLESLSLHLAPILAVLALAAVLTFSSQHYERAPQASYAAAVSAPASPRTPYGSAAAVRALLF